MPAYVIARVKVTDPERYQEYTALTPGLVAKWGGRFIVRGSPVTTKEGEAEDRRVVVLEFPDRKTAEGFYNSEEYEAAKQIRLSASDGQLIIVDGVE